MYGHPTSCAKLILPAWTRRYPALRKALPTMWAVTRTDAARAALQRILNYPKVEQALRPLLPDGCSDNLQHDVADGLRAAACAVDAPMEKWEEGQRTAYVGALESAASYAHQGRYHDAEWVQTQIRLFGGPPPLERPGTAMQMRLRYARSMLCHWAADPDGDPPYALVAALLAVVFEAHKPVTADSVRKFWEAERRRLDRK